MTSRVHYRQELEALEAQALGGLELVARAVERALETVEHQDVELAAMVISDDDRIDGRYLEVHQSILTLFALQTPMAGDLRLLAALLHVIRHVERMGDQCVNMAKLVPLAGHEPPADEGMLRLIHGMGVQAGSQTVQARQSFERRDVGLARDLVRQDDEIDRLNREVFRLAIEIGDDPDRREWAMHMMLVARYLERIGDNAVDVGEQTAFDGAVPRVRGRLAPRPQRRRRLARASQPRRVIPGCCSAAAEAVRRGSPRRGGEPPECS